MGKLDYVINKLSPAGGAAKKAGHEATKTTRRKFVTGTAALLAGDQVLNGGNLREGTVEAGGNLVEEIEDPPMEISDIDTLGEYNDVVEGFLNKKEDFEVDGRTWTPLRKHLHQSFEDRHTDNGRVPETLEEGHRFVEDKYLTFETEHEQIKDAESGDEATTAVFAGEDNNWIALTNSAAEVQGFEDYGFFAINSEDNELDHGELEKLEEGYRRAIDEVNEALSTIEGLLNNGRSYKRGGKEFEDEDELENYEELEDNIEELEERRDELLNKRSRFRTYAGLFQHTLDETPYDDGESISGRGSPDRPHDPEEPEEPWQYTVSDSELDHYQEETEGFDQLAENIEEGSATQNTVYREDGAFMYDNGDVVTSIPEEFAKDLKEFIH